MLSTHWLIDHTEVSVLFDNESIYGLCQKCLGIKTPSYDHINRLIVKVISSITASLRFEGELNVDLNEYQTNMVPFPRLHFMFTGMAPISTPQQIHLMGQGVYSITESCFEPNSFLIK